MREFSNSQSTETLGNDENSFFFANSQLIRYATIRMCNAFSNSHQKNGYQIFQSSCFCFGVFPRRFDLKKCPYAIRSIEVIEIGRLIFKQFCRTIVQYHLLDINNECENGYQNYLMANNTAWDIFTCRKTLFLSLPLFRY